MSTSALLFFFPSLHTDFDLVLTPVLEIIPTLISSSASNGSDSLTLEMLDNFDLTQASASEILLISTQTPAFEIYQSILTLILPL